MQVLLFGLAATKYGILLQDVKFISRKINVIKLNNAFKAVTGVVRLRDKVMPVYSLSSCFGMEEQETCYLLVVKWKEFDIAIEVGMVDKVICVEQEAVVSLPFVLAARRPCFRYVIRYGGELIGLLDIERIFCKQDSDSFRQILGSIN